MKVSVPNDFTSFEDPTLTNPIRTCPKPYTHVQTPTKINCNMPQKTTHTLLLRQYAERIPFPGIGCIKWLKTKNKSTLTFTLFSTGEKKLFI